MARWRQINKGRGARCVAGLALAVAILGPATAHAATDVLEDLRQMSLEELAGLEVSSVSKHPEPLGEAAASIYVITAEDIRRSGATSLAEALRLAPNLQVAQRDASSYAITARGFNGFEISNKLLVLIDGRSVYTNLHAGVLWDERQVMLADVDRIEVISGPGGTLWGANAVNGVINVVTRDSHDTQGGLFDGFAGNTQRSAAARYGTYVDDNIAARVYGFTFERDETQFANGDGSGDAWSGRQAGFRSDMTFDADTIRFQGDIFDDAIESGDLDGGNLVLEWVRDLGEGAALQAQAFVDHTSRVVTGVNDRATTYDIEAQHLLPLGESHEIVWGGGHRIVASTFDVDPGVSPFTFSDPDDTQELSNVFVQDRITLDPSLTLTLGTKFEHDSNAGWEYMPSAHLGWLVAPDQFLWAAVSRAVRSPSRIDRELQAPGFFDAASDFETEKVIAYEIGYRGQPSATTTLSVSLFYNDHDDLRVIGVSPTTGAFTFENWMNGYTFGGEAWGTWQVLPWWRLEAGGSVLRKSMELQPGATRVAFNQHYGNDPEYQYSLRSRMDLDHGLELDLGMRAVDQLDNPVVDDYVAVDARLGWHVTDRLELSLVGQNLLDDRHPETDIVAGRQEIRRSVYVGLRWTF